MRSRLTSRTAAQRIVRRLRAAGHEALFAGGCVRDMLLGRRPKDYDVVTDAPPGRIVELFARTRKVGMQFGVVIVQVGGQWIEVATFRSDAEYANGRHPTGVVFSTAREDAARRDFTINGMFYDPVGRRVIDYVGGQADLRRRVIRAIGEPERRFAEDHLRMLRAVRLATELGFRIAPATGRAIRRHADWLRRISAERIREELELLLTARHRARGFAELAKTRLLEQLWPDEPWPADRIAHAVAVLDRLPMRVSFELALSAVLLRSEPSRLDGLCRQLTCSNRTRKAVIWLVRQQMRLCEQPELELADLKALMQHERFDELLGLLRAELLASGRPLGQYRRLRRRAAAIDRASVAPAPLLSGHDLVRMGLKPGPLFKRLLEATYRAQLNEQVGSRTEALAFVRRLLETH